MDCNVQPEKVKKFCPLLGGSCLGKGCGWFNSYYGVCGVRLAIRM